MAYSEPRSHGPHRRPGARSAATIAGSSACMDVWCFCRCVRCLKVAGHNRHEKGRSPRCRLFTWRRRPSEKEKDFPHVVHGWERAPLWSATTCFFRLLRSANRRRHVTQEYCLIFRCTTRMCFRAADASLKKRKHIEHCAGRRRDDVRDTGAVFTGETGLTGGSGWRSRKGIGDSSFRRKLMLCLFVGMGRAAASGRGRVFSIVTRWFLAVSYTRSP